MDIVSADKKSCLSRSVTVFLKSVTANVTAVTTKHCVL